MNMQQYINEGYEKDRYLYAFRKDFGKFTITVFPKTTVISFGKTQINLNRVISPSGIELVAQIIYDTINEETN